MTRLCDLHTHSIFSDGTDSPERIIQLAKDAGLCAVALCDHNTVDGLPDFQRAAEGSGVEAIGGIEISVDHKGTELHLIGMFLRPEHYGPIRALLADGNRQKEESNVALAKALCDGGYPVDYDAMCRKAGGQLNRAHFAAALTEAGFTKSVQHAFETILDEKSGFYHPPRRPDAGDVVTYLRTMGIAPILAHPMIDLTEDALRAFLQETVPRGLLAMETRYPLYDGAMSATALAMAKEFAILESGGSDYHGKTKPDIRIGSGKGNVAIPTEILEALRKGVSQ